MSSKVIPMVTQYEAAEQFGVSIKTIRRWTAERRIESQKLPGGAVRIRQAVIDAELAKGVVHAEPPRKRPVGSFPRTVRAQQVA
jgi:excisionase family DNA binding protein